MTANDKLKAVVLGASGYTGAELLRLVATHGGIEIVALTAARRAGSPLGDVHPHLDGLMLPDLVAVDDVDWSVVDAVFSCLPHGTAQATIASLPGHLKVVDLSADYRLGDPRVYAEWYGKEHVAPGPSARCRLRADRDQARRGCRGAAGRQPRLLHHDRGTGTRSLP